MSRNYCTNVQNNMRGNHILNGPAYEMSNPLYLSMRRVNIYHTIKM
uniref:Uncharacterized protein n=1 Tax=Arundo donax TaxID=35708 RepID=A0A0A9BSE5_ARUDO